MKIIIAGAGAVAIGKMQMSSEKIMAADSGVAVKVTRVLMDPGHYPRMWKYSTDIECLPDSQ